MIKTKPNIEKTNKSPYYGTILINRKDDEDEIVEGEGESLTPFNSEIMLSGIHKIPEELFVLVMNKLKGSKDYYEIVTRYADLGRGSNELKNVLIESYNLLNGKNNDYEKNFKTNAPIRIDQNKRYFKVKQR